MSKQYPECPLYNHNNCKELHIPKVCAIVRDDNECLRKSFINKKKVSENNINIVSAKK